MLNNQEMCVLQYNDVEGDKGYQDYAISAAWAFVRNSKDLNLFLKTKTVY